MAQNDLATHENAQLRKGALASAHTRTYTSKILTMAVGHEIRGLLLRLFWNKREKLQGQTVIKIEAGNVGVGGGGNRGWLRGVRIGQGR